MMNESTVHADRSLEIMAGVAASLDRKAARAVLVDAKRPVSEIASIDVDDFRQSGIEKARQMLSGGNRR